MVRCRRERRSASGLIMKTMFTRAPAASTISLKPEKYGCCSGAPISSRSKPVTWRPSRHGGSGALITTRSKPCADCVWAKKPFRRPSDSVVAAAEIDQRGGARPMGEAVIASTD